jgi:hypothetical protein
MPVPGRTLFLPRDVDIHRHVIISDPRSFPHDPVVFAKFTTFAAGKDPTCIILPEDFTSLPRVSCIHYADANSVALPDFEGFVSSGHISLSMIVPSEVLDRIRDGFGKSLEAAITLKEILQQQGLIIWERP